MELRDQREPGWLWAGNDIIDVYGPKIGAAGIAVYMALARFAGNRGMAWPGLDTLCEKVSLSKPTLIKAIACLEGHGLIAVERRPGGANVYTLLRLEAQSGSKAALLGGKEDLPGSKAALPPPVKPVDGGSKAALPEEDSVKKTHSEENKEREKPEPLAALAAPPPEPETIDQSLSEPVLEVHPVYLLAVALAAVCGMDLALNKARLCKDAKALIGASPPATPELLTRHYGCDPGVQTQTAWWWVSDWRGQKGEWPSPATIKSTWGQWAQATPPAKRGGRANGSHTSGYGLTADAGTDRRSRAPTDAERAEILRFQREFAEQHGLDPAGGGFG
jgi:hypothetical protein